MCCLGLSVICNDTGLMVTSDATPMIKAYSKDTFIHGTCCQRDRGQAVILITDAQHSESESGEDRNHAHR